MYIGDGAKLVRDAFDLAKEKITKEGRKVLYPQIDSKNEVYCNSELKSNPKSTFVFLFYPKPLPWP
jgi:hypothetical protein